MNQIGIYEQLITQVIENRIDKEIFYVGDRQLDTSEAAIWLSRFITKVIYYVIDSIPQGENRLQGQIELANKLIFWLKDQIDDPEFFDENLIESKGRILTSLFDKKNPVASDLERYTKSIFPLTGLTQSELFSGSNAGLSLESELKREIASSDEIYWLVSFIKWAGIRIFKKELEDFTHSGKKLKIITTSYMGATDAKAVMFLAGLPNTEVKLSYNTQHERLHAKSYLFIRKTGFNTGYIGSSNLSQSALTTGLEWNLKITSQEIPHIIEKSLSTFKTYWQSNDFETFNGEIESKNKLLNALIEARGNNGLKNNFHFDIKPFPHQVEILELLDCERNLHNRFRNLVVAATGTGKTIISAFDFVRFFKKNPQAKFLFIAHRQEILVQAMNAYRGVLKNNSFGELWVGNYSPDRYNHLFASIQTLNSQLELLDLTKDYYDYIVIDEVHHITAQSYRGILEKFEPKILLGLTATPERHDGQNILDDFCGVIAAEIRLPEAINRRHLCPFQYFGIDDDTDLSQISWKNGRYDPVELTNLYTHSEQRIKRIIQNISEIITDVMSMKALAFCVSKEHAEYMTKKFLLNEIPCDFLTSDNSDDRLVKQQKLRTGEIKILCVVDIFNEGVDIPEVDTLLFLRPTESLTIFLQQLGRGLRLSDEKQCCTVLDFVGNSRPEYDFTQKFRALVGKTNQSIESEVSKGFPHLPLGCRIELQEKTQSMILQNIRRAVLNKQRLIGLIQNFPNQSSLPLNIRNFLTINSNIELEDIYNIKSPDLSGWTSLLDLANNNDKKDSAEMTIYSSYYRAINNHLLACTSISYLQFIHKLSDNNFIFNTTDFLENRYALICHYNFWGKSGKELNYSSLSEGLSKLRHPRLQDELNTVLDVLINRIHDNEISIDNSVIKVHARYTREQILAGYGASSFEKSSTSREGVLSLESENTELLFVTLNKNEKQFSPTTMYHDFALSDVLFHWQSQNSAKPEKGKGLSYVNHHANGMKIILFVREQAKDENGRTMGFVNFGPVKYLSHQGSQPMNITWELEIPMPANMWHEAAKLAMP